MKNVVFCFIVMMLVISSVYPQSEEKNNQVQNFREKYPGDLSIQWDKISGGPKRMIGNNIYLKSRSINKTNIHALTKDFINENEDLFNVRKTELELESISELGGKFIVTYQLLFNKLPLWNVKLRLKIAANGQVLMIKSPSFDNPNLSVQPRITRDEAKKEVGSRFNTSIKKIQGGELLIYPERETGKLYLCWHVKIEDGVNKGIMIDAQTGQILNEYDLYRNNEIKGTVKTKTWSLPGQTDGTPDITPYCQDLKINVAGMGSINTNSSGYYSITVPSVGNYYIYTTLDGPHCLITNWTGSEAGYDSTASTSTDHNWTWHESEHYNEYFVFNYMNNAWHEFNDKVSGFSSNYWYNQKMEGRANYGSGVNGSASGAWMGITTSNHYGCSVYHEYSHNVNYRTNGSWLGSSYNGDGYAMDEGLADYYSCSFRNDPVRYAVNRRLDTKMKYPGSGGAHERGQIIGGACWDLAHKSGISLNYVNALVYEAITNMGFEETFGDFMDEILSADDDDGNIFNGTPHDDQICDAFVNDHAILGSFLSGNITSNITINKNLAVIGNVTVLSGYTLTVDQGKNITFVPGMTLIVNGTLNAVGTSTSKITFTKSGASNWGGIQFNSGSSGTLDYCDVTYATTGINMYNSSPTIKHSTIDNCSGVGIFCDYYSSPVLVGNNIWNNSSYGLRCNFYSSPNLTDYGYPGSNVIRNNLNGVYTAYNCIPNLNGYMTSGNSVFDNTSQEVVAYYNSTVNANKVYWGATFPPPDAEFYTSSSTINRNDPLQTNPNPNRKIISKENNFKAPVFSIMSSQSDDLNLAEEKQKERKYDEAINLFLEVFKKEKENSKGRYALIKIEECFTQAGMKDFLDFSKRELKPLIKEENELFVVLLELETHQLYNQKDANQAMNNLKMILNKYNLNSEIEKQTLYRMGAFYLDLFNDRASAQKTFDDLAAKYPEDELLTYANLMLNENRYDNPKGRNADQQIVDTTKVEEELSNHPNPFNPTTKITFTLSTRDVVKLKVYDILGREIAVLAEGQFEVGRHKIEFNASRLPSGVYFYNLTTSTSSVTKKMLLLK